MKNEFTVEEHIFHDIARTYILNTTQQIMLSKLSNLLKFNFYCGNILLSLCIAFTVKT